MFSWITQCSLAGMEPRVVCYYTNWSVYRPGTAKFNPQNINPYLCTHLVYAFGGFTKENNFKPFDKYQDIEKGGYAKFTGLKTYNKNLKTMLAIGGWNEGSSRFSPLVANAERRKEFVKNSIKFLRQNHFDGLDLDWEYPSFRDGGKPRDRDNYATLVEELREEYERESEKTGRPRLLLTMAVPAGIEYINKGYDVPRLMKYLDWMNILSYDYHSAFEPSVNHHSPLYGLEEASEYNYDAELNINHTIAHYLEAGAEPDKLVLGIPTYGRSYTLFNPEAAQIGDPADGPGEMGDATRENGYLAYYEICEKLKEGGWTVENPNKNAMGPYAYKENQWVGYDDLDIVRKKSEFVVERNLGGIMFWSIDNDDFRGSCHDKPYPLIEAAKEALLASVNKVDTYKSKTRNRPNRKEEEISEISRPVRKRVRPKIQREEEGIPKRKIKIAKTTTITTTTAKTTLSTPKYYTPEPPTTPDAGSDFKCEDEGFFPHPRDCKKYFWCLSSGPSELGIVAHQFTCPSGLYFNKAADSCDYTQNVRCVKPKSTTTSSSTSSTTSTTSTTTTTTSVPFFSTRRVPSKITAATSRSTYLATTPELDEYEYEYEDDVIDSEEDPQVIKELIHLIKKAGGIEELEKQLMMHANGSALVTNSGVTTPSVFSKTLYERVLKSTKTTDGISNINRATNSRGPQYTSAPETESTRSRGRLQYTAINRQRSTTEKDEVIVEAPPEDVQDRNSNKSPNVPEYVSIIRQGPSVTKDVSVDVVTQKTSIPEYVTIRRSRPTTETLKVEENDAEVERSATAVTAHDDVLISIKNNFTHFEVTQQTTESVSRRYTEASIPTVKVSDPITSKNILKPRPTQSETVYTNRYKIPPARTTETPSTKATEEPVRGNKPSRRRGYTRFELLESYDQELPDTKYQDRKFRPDIALEISDLSSLTSVDIAKPINGNSRRRIVPRPHTSESPLIETTTSTLRATIRNLVASRKPFSRVTVERSTSTTSASAISSSSTTIFPSTEVSTRARRVIKRFRSTPNSNTTASSTTSTTTTGRTTTTTTTPSTETVITTTSPFLKTTTTTTTTATPKDTAEPLPSVTEKDNLITDYDLYQTPEEEDENIRLSESTIREKSELHFNALQNELEKQQIFEKISKTSYLDKATESPNTFYRTRKVIRKLTPTTEITTTPNKNRTRKVIRKLVTTPTVPKMEEISEDDEKVPLSTEALIIETETNVPTFKDAVTTSSVVDSEEPTTISVSSTESTPAEKITPFYYRAKLSRPPFVLQRTKAVAEPSTSTTPTGSSTKNNFRRFERKKTSSTTTTTEKVLHTIPAYSTTSSSFSRNRVVYSTPSETTVSENVDNEQTEPTTLIEITTQTTNAIPTEYVVVSTTSDEIMTDKPIETETFTTQPSHQTITETGRLLLTTDKLSPQTTTTQLSSPLVKHDKPDIIRNPYQLKRPRPNNPELTTRKTDQAQKSSNSPEFTLRKIEQTAKFANHPELRSRKIIQTIKSANSPELTQRSTEKLSKSQNTPEPTPLKIEDPKSVNALLKNNRTKGLKIKFTNRNIKTTTAEPTTVELVTLLHVFAETDNPTTTPSPAPSTPPSSTTANDKIERLLEVNRIVEVSLKEGKMKSNNMIENEITLIPVLDRIGAISRITNIQIVDSSNETESIINKTYNFTPKPDSESSTIALEGLFHFKNEEDEVLETEHARYVNVKILNQDDASTPLKHSKDGKTIPLRIMSQDDDYSTSRAEVIEITPTYNSDLIRIAPIAITLKNMSHFNWTLP
ncbi:hypothetical protein FQR65_LT11104 [Abscondita terminalis]|nr:hypothetical protein FQR65_LT11104 [Abscondita terminalis]